MNTSEDCHPFILHQEAWQAARPTVDDRGDLQSDIDEAIHRFTRRKVSKKFTESEAADALQCAINMLQATVRFRRKNIGISTPKTIRRYEILYELAKHLSEEFHDAPDAYILFACRDIEQSWDR